jgi:GntR family transcriptional regulator/MocR family aminotransferase
MRADKSHLLGQFAVNRRLDVPLSLQIVGQLQRAIEGGDVTRGATLPSSRALARALGVSRNTVLVAFDELKARGFIVGHRGAGMRVVASGIRSFDVRRLLREAQYPERRVTIEDPDGNPISLSY